MPKLNYESPLDRPPPPVAFPSVARWLVLLSAAVEIILLLWLIVPNLFTHSIHPVRRAIAGLLVPVLVLAFIIQQLRNPELRPALLYAIANVLAIGISFLVYLGNAMSGQANSLALTTILAGFFAAAATVTSLYAYQLRRFELSAAASIRSEIGTPLVKTARVESTTRTTVTIIKDRHE